MIDDPVLVNDWHIVARSDDVTRDAPSTARLLREDLVLWRDPSGQPHAWKDLCLHRGTKLSMGSLEDGTLQCPYHGWKYNEEGYCVEIPAHPDQPPPKKFTVERYRTAEKFGCLWVSLGDPEQDPPDFPEWEKNSFRSIFCTHQEFNAAATRAVENFLDVAHFPYVHEGTLGDPSEADIPEFEVVPTENGFYAPDVKVYQPDPDGTGEGRYVHYEYRSLRPFTAYLAKKGEKRLSIMGSVTPVEETRSIMWMFATQNYGEDISDEKIAEFHNRILSEDIPIVESQRPELLPKDLQAELHRPSDRCSLAYRKWINELGLSFGTA